MYEYLWGGPIHRVKRDIMEQSYENGGIKMINLKNFIDSLKITWIRRIIADEKDWYKVFFFNFKTEILFGCGDNYAKGISLNTNNQFWKL